MADTKLSICIATFNRAPFIGATLESILSQVTSTCEVIVLDGASVDDTQQVVQAYAKRYAHLRYIRQDTNNGIDKDFDRAVELASGDYCWLFSDDDLLKPNAIANVLGAIAANHSLILVNAEHRDFEMSAVRVPNYFGIQSDRVYSAQDMDRLFVELGRCLICICCIVIRRDLWLSRERTRYHGSLFAHVGVIFQSALPGSTLAISTPLMCLRLGNEQTHAKDGFQVWHINWPNLVWSLPLSATTKHSFSVEQPWRRFKYLLALRITGAYSLKEYRRWIRPHLTSPWKLLIPIIAAATPRKLAPHFYAICALVEDEPAAPHEVWWNLFPPSLKAIRPDART